MTKHLRLIMLSLLAMICMGGYSQSDELYKTLSFPDENKVNNGKGNNNYVSVWNAKIGTDSWRITNFNNNNWANSWSYIKCGREKYTSKAKIETNTSLDAEISKIEVTYGKTTKVDKVLDYYLLVASDRDFTKNVEKIQGKLKETKSETTDVFIITSPAKGRYFRLYYDLDKTGANGNIQINKIDYYKKSDKADSQIKFNEAAKEVELKTEMMSLSDLISNPNKLPLTYSTSDKETAEELDGTLLLYKTGKVTVTASFAGNDTYAATSTSMELTIVDNRLDAGISFAKDSYTAGIAKGTFNGAELVKPEGLEVAYEITHNTEGVSIAQDGTVTYPAVEATYTVTAKFAGNDTYKPATATYTLNVVDNRQDAGIQFAKDSYTADIAQGTFNGAELVKPEGLEVAYEITHNTEGVSIAQDGTVTYPAVEATYTVTAKFAGNDTYKPATATYTLNVVDPNFEIQTIEFVAGVDKGTGASTGSIKDDMISKGIVTVSSTRACLGLGGYYAFYKPVTSNEGIHTINTRMGTITKIAFEAGNGKEPSKATFTEGTYTKDNDGTKNYTWTGSEKTINFTVTDGTYYSKITVTVKVPVAKDYTLDENSVNTIEAYENANVTLKRTFFHDNAWNTLCLPFDVDANEVATAFAGAEIREIDHSQCKDNTIQFVPATEIKAGVPYIIKWNENVAEAKPFEKTFEGVTLVAEPKPVKVNNDITFTGFYNKTTADKLGTSVAAVGAGSKLFKVVGEGEMKGFRAAFVLNPTAQLSAFNVVIDGVTNGIEDLVIDGVKANGRVYNLNGQYVGNSLNGLQPGLYIQNGKKIVVK